VAVIASLPTPPLLAVRTWWCLHQVSTRALQGALPQASVAGSSGHRYVDQCHAAIAVRRDWTIPLTVTGALLLGGLMVRPSRRLA
jgi:hypothetical protein